MTTRRTQGQTIEDLKMILDGMWENLAHYARDVVPEAGVEDSNLFFHEANLAHAILSAQIRLLDLRYPDGGEEG